MEGWRKVSSTEAVWNLEGMSKRQHEALNKEKQHNACMAEAKMPKNRKVSGRRSDANDSLALRCSEPRKQWECPLEDESKKAKLA